jgi:hydrogenase nickel incorporation protein HypA/HybF
MHESTLAMNILEIVTDQAGKASVTAVHRVNLCVGDLAGVEATTLSACFEMLAQGTIADAAKLAVRRIPATGTCAVCGAQARKQGRLLRCPHCEKSSITLATGREFYVESMEVE